jgi:hypothetical protein
VCCDVVFVVVSVPCNQNKIERNHLGSTIWWRWTNASRQNERKRSDDDVIDVRTFGQLADAAAAVEMGDEAAETAELAGTTSLTFVVSPTLTWIAAAASSPVQSRTYQPISPNKLKKKSNK